MTWSEDYHTPPARPCLQFQLVPTFGPRLHFYFDSQKQLECTLWGSYFVCNAGASMFCRPHRHQRILICCCGDRSSKRRGVVENCYKLEDLGINLRPPRSKQLIKDMDLLKILYFLSYNPSSSPLHFQSLSNGREGN